MDNFGYTEQSYPDPLQDQMETLVGLCPGCGAKFVWVYDEDHVPRSICGGLCDRLDMEVCGTCGQVFHTVHGYSSCGKCRKVEKDRELGSRYSWLRGSC